MNKKIISFSIIVPVYNVEKYLVRCIESIINQTYPQIEVILVDDGSIDTSSFICDEYLKRDNRVKVIHKDNGGLSDARNVGLKNCSGEYILFVDSDDYLELDACEKIYNNINDEFDIIQGYAQVEGNYNTFYKCLYTSNAINGKDYLKIALQKQQFYDPVFLRAYKRSFLINNNLDFKKGFFHEDVDFTARVFIKANSIRCIDCCLYHYIIREGSITTKKDKSKNLIDLFGICKDLIGEIKLLDDKKLSKLLANKLVNNYLSLYYSANGYKYNTSKEIKKFCLKNSHNFKTKIKSLLFSISPKLYWKINNSTKRK